MKVEEIRKPTVDKGKLCASWHLTQNMSSVFSVLVQDKNKSAALEKHYICY